MDIEYDGRTYRVKPGYEGLIEQCMRYEWFWDQLWMDARTRQWFIDMPIDAHRGPIRFPMSPLSTLGDDLGL